MPADSLKSHTACIVMDVQRTTVAYIGEDQAFLIRLIKAIAIASGFLPSATLEIHPTVAPQSGEVVVTKVRAARWRR
jgi:hypothetical protein